MRRLALFMVGALCATAPAAHAAVVSLEYEAPIPGLDPESVYSLTVTGGDGPDALALSRDATGYELRELRQGTIEAGTGCRLVSERVARCDTPEPATHYDSFVELGGGDDMFDGRTLIGERLELQAGGGADTIAGTPEWDSIGGGGGDDWLAGGDGSDRLRGGRGEDILLGGTGGDRLLGGAGKDVLLGGEGPDVALYSDHREPVVVDLARGTGGPGAELDSIDGVESAGGGLGADRIYGDDNPNALSGGPGQARDARDVVVGRGGGDLLTGWRVIAGSGDDRMDSQRPACGKGEDTLVRLLYRTRGPYPRKCELVTSFFFTLSNRPERAGDNAVAFKGSCPAGLCIIDVELRDRRGLLGRGHFRSRAAAGRSRRVVVKLRRPPRKRLVTVRLESDEGYTERFRTRLPRR